MFKGVMFLLAVLFSTSAFAGVRAYNGNTDLKIFDALQCSSGMSCSRAKNGKLVMTAPTNNVVQNRIAAVAGTATASQCGSTFTNSGAVEVDLPLASTVYGCRYTFITMNASNFDIDPDAADRVLALTNANGDRARNATVGNSITIEAVVGGWAIVGIYGTWTDAD